MMTVILKVETALPLDSSRKEFDSSTDQDLSLGSEHSGRFDTQLTIVP